MYTGCIYISVINYCYECVSCVMSKYIFIIQDSGKLVIFNETQGKSINFREFGSIFAYSGNLEILVENIFSFTLFSLSVAVIIDVLYNLVIL